MLIKKCLICKKEFYVWKYKFKIRKFCSKKCSNINESQIRKGKYPKGLKEYHKIYLSWNKGKTMPKGDKSSHWKGGKKRTKFDYIFIYNPEHPFSNCSGYIFEHRLIIEKHINRYLKPKEKCHHLGKRDNNRPNMLMAFINQSAHLRFHKNPNNVKPSEIIFDGRKIKLW